MSEEKRRVVSGPARLTPDGDIEMLPAVHPVCPGCGKLLLEWDLMPPGADGKSWYIKMDMIDDDLALCVLTTYDCECGHTSDWSPFPND